jgi:hypothetical protein
MADKKESDSGALKSAIAAVRASIDPQGTDGVDAHLELTQGAHLNLTHP